MTSLEHPTPPAKPTGKNGTHTSAARKAGAAKRPQPHHLEPDATTAIIRCPRCDSPNTKFCYYNNYSLTQPRHFCKTCRRYWTKGGALRNVPIGGGCRKNKKLMKPSSLSGDSNDITTTGGSISSGEGSGGGGLRFFQGLSPAMDFQLTGINMPNSTTAAAAGFFNQFSPFGNNSSAANSAGISVNPNNGFNLEYPNLGFSSSPSLLGFQEMGTMNNLASSIESLSFINQDLHWKLQQQRLAMMFGNGDDDNNNNINHHHQQQQQEIQTIEESHIHKPQPVVFQSLEKYSNPTDDLIGTSLGNDGTNGRDLSTEWFFDDHYNNNNYYNSNYATNHHVDPTPATSSNNNDNENRSWSGFQAWNDLTQCMTPSLP